MFNGRIGFVYQVVHWLVAAAIAKRNPFDLSLSLHLFLFISGCFSLSRSLYLPPPPLFISFLCREVLPTVFSPEEGRGGDCSVGQTVCHPPDRHSVSQCLCPTVLGERPRGQQRTELEQVMFWIFCILFLLSFVANTSFSGTCIKNRSKARVYELKIFKGLFFSSAWKRTAYLS